MDFPFSESDNPSSNSQQAESHGCIYYSDCGLHSSPRRDNHSSSTEATWMGVKNRYLASSRSYLAVTYTSTYECGYIQLCFQQLLLRANGRCTVVDCMCKNIHPCSGMDPYWGGWGGYGYGWDGYGRDGYGSYYPVGGYPDRRGGDNYLLNGNYPTYVNSFCNCNGNSVCIIDCEARLGFKFRA